MRTVSIFITLFDDTSFFGTLWHLNPWTLRPVCLYLMSHMVSELILPQRLIALYVVFTGIVDADSALTRRSRSVSGLPAYDLLTLPLQSH